MYYHEDVEGYVHSQQQLNLLIDEERARMVELGKEPRIVVMGFSQGEPQMPSTHPLFVA